MNKKEVEQKLATIADQVLSLRLPELPEEVRQEVAAMLRRTSHEIRTARISFKG